jgi:phospholipid transport system substrate-binding protein
MRRNNLMGSLGLACGLGLWSPAFSAPATDGVFVQLETFHHALLEIVKIADVKTRATILGPAMTKTFNHVLMAQYIVGNGWAELSVADRAAIDAALLRYLTTRFAHDFSHNDGVRIAVSPQTTDRGADKLVRTTIEEPDQEADRIDYRMRQYAGAWQVIDVYADGVSELATQRADLADAFEKGGARAVVAHLKQATEKISN